MSHVRIEVAPPRPDIPGEPDILCRCNHCGATLQRGMPAALADILETAEPFLERHDSCRSAAPIGGAS